MKLRPFALPAIGAFCTLSMMMWSSVAKGGISVVDQSRVIHIDASSQLPSPPFTNPPPFDQTVTATAFTPFDQSLSNSLQSNSETLATASASQTSTLALAADSSMLRLTVTGAAAANDGAQSFAGTNSTYYVLFTLDAPSTYTLIERQSDLERAGAELDLPNQGARLLSGTFNPLFPTDLATFVFPSQSLTPDLQGLPLNQRGTQTLSGTLGAGTYTLEGGAFGTPGEADASGTYSLDFTLSSSSNSSGTPVAAPLPAGGWMGLSMIALLSGACIIRRRQSRNG
jgi:hypothetical protein